VQSETNVRPVHDSGQRRSVSPSASPVLSDREKALRKAVSLSYLRQTGKLSGEKEKKVPTEEHLSELRSALASLAGDNKEERSVAHTPPEVREPEVVKIVEKVNEDDNIKVVVPAHEGEKVKLVIDSPEDKNSSNRASERNVDEVPEDVLKIILDIKK
jgi:hypothetical protein